MHILPYGPNALLVDEVADPAALAATIAAADLDGIIESVPSERAVLLRCESAALDAVAAVIDSLDDEDLAAAVDDDRPEVSIDVRYDGADLDDVAQRAAMSVEEVVRRFEAPVYDVAFCGFSPGFAYLRGLDERLHLPRRSTPRTRVEPGSVAIAAHYAAVYPSPSPGGWHLLGTTSAAVWNLEREQPALLTPGTSVRFRSAP